MSEYQHASDFMYGKPPYSGVIRTADGKFIANQAVSESPDWQAYLDWAAIEGNVADPYLAPEAGGVALVLEEGEVPVGTMLDSMPLEAEVTSPRVVDVPFASGTTAVGDTLSVTMGNWEGEPTSYTGEWVHADTGDRLGSGPDHIVTEEDQGHDLACIVIATNVHGSTRSPMSNVISIPLPVVVPPAGDGVTVESTRRVEPEPEAKVEPEHENHRRGRHRE